MNRLVYGLLYVILSVLAAGMVIAVLGIRMVANLFMVETFLAAAAFCAVYMRRNWQRTAVGWNLMAFGVVLLIETGLAVSTLFLGVQWPYRDWVRAFAWALVGGVMTWRVALLFTTHPPPTVDPSMVLVRCPHYPNCCCSGPTRKEGVDD